MKATEMMKLLEKYGECPKCGSDKLGNGNGSLEIGDNYIKRTCKCGYKKVIKND